MTVQEVINFARYSELDKLSDKSITDDKVLSYINLGIIELYKRFTLKTSEQVIAISDNVTTYTLNTDVLNIVEVVDEEGNLYSLNNENDALSILTPSWNEIQVPNPRTGTSLSVIYIATHSLLTNLTDVVPIPLSLLEALLHYIGYKAHAAQNGSIQAENNTHYTRFEASCKRALDLGVTTQDDLNYRYSTAERGFL